MTLAEALQLKSLGKYELIVSLGRGGMANVYLAIVAGPARFNKLLVLKILREDVLSSADEAVKMFLDEARLSARLVHPNIVHTYEVGECDGHYFMAMEYLDGQSYRTLQQRARASGGIPIHEELRILSETARGLHYVHELEGYNGERLNVVHRDVSPQNVFITFDGQVKLLDFGIAKASDSEHLTQVGVIKGKLEYIAPEQIQGEHVDRRADVFSLGAMLWEAITGKRFAGGPKVSEVTKVHTRMTGGEPNVRTVQPDVPEALARIVDRALALKPDERFPDAAAMADAIDDYLAKSGQKPSAKSLAAFVAPLLSEERRQTAKLIEQQIQLIKERGTSHTLEHTGSLPRLKLGEDSTSGLYVGGQDLARAGSESAPRSLAPLRAEPTPKQAPKGALIAAGAAALGLALAAALWLGRPSAPTNTPVTSAPLAAAAQPAAQPAPVPERADPAASAEPKEPALVALTLEVTPSDAAVTLDGAPIAAPFQGKFRKDASLHHLEIAAEGYRPHKQLIAFDRDQAFAFSLERLHERSAASASRRARPVEREPAAVPESAPTVSEKEPAPAAEPSLAPGADLKRVRPRISRGHIDAVDPYATP